MYDKIASKWPLGLDLIAGLILANNRQRLMQYYQLFIGRVGPNFEQHLLADVGLITFDPENIKTILSRSKLHEGEFGPYHFIDPVSISLTLV